MISRRSGVESVKIAGSSQRLSRKESVTTPARNLLKFIATRISSSNLHPKATKIEYAARFPKPSKISGILVPGEKRLRC